MKSKIKGKFSVTLLQEPQFSIKNGYSGITLVALVVTIVVLLILARNNY